MERQCEPCELGALWRDVNDRGDGINGKIELSGYSLERTLIHNLHSVDQVGDWAMDEAERKRGQERWR